MEKVESKNLIRFIILSIVGVFLYFVPLKDAQVPVVMIVNFVKGLLGNNLQYVVVLALVLLMASIIGAKVFKNEFCQKLHAGDSNAKLVHYVIAFLVVIAVLFKLPPHEIFVDERIGGGILSMAGTVFMTVSICGWLIVFILKSGIVEFFGILLEPLMRPLFKLPGAAAVNYLSSFVVSAAVGVFMTDQYYENKVYTKREAICAATCFSTISVGYIGVLASIGGINSFYGVLLPLAFVVTFIMTIILVRIPPLSLYKNHYIDNSETIEEVKVEGNRLNRAILAASLKSQEFSLKAFFDSMFSALKFGQRIIAYMIPIVIVTESIVYYTPIFTWLGQPIAPILSMLQIPDAAKVAPAVLLGFIEVSLPVISVSGGAVATKGVFFVVLLSISQIIFMTEAGNAMLGTKMNIKIQDLVLNFLVRTVVAVPIVALITNLMF